MLCSSCSKNDDETIPTSFLNSQTFPDANFRAYIAEKTGIPEGEAIPAEVIASITSIDVREKDIASLKGIELFTELTTLYCYFNQLTQLDVSNNTKLTGLFCDNNPLTQLNVSNNTELTYLWCYLNSLTQLDVSNNTKLTDLNCCSNQLTQLNVSNNTELTSLYCSNNQLTQLDVSNNTELTNLSCSQQFHLPIQSLPDGKYGIRLSDDTDATRVQDLRFGTTPATCNIEEYEGHKYLIISYETNRVTYNYECDSTRKMYVIIYVDH